MKHVLVKIKGTRPLLINSFKVETLTELQKVKSGKAGNDPNEWKASVLEKNGQLFLPGSYIRGSLRDGARYTKSGRGSIQKVFVSAMMVITDQALIDRHLPEGWEDMEPSEMPLNSDAPLYLDIRAVTNPTSKGRNARYRVACSPGWKTEFEFEFDDNVVSEAQVKKIVIDSGSMGGIGDARSLGYGRYKVEELQVKTVEI